MVACREEAMWVMPEVDAQRNHSPLRVFDSTKEAKVV
jgi:hypothetical protein